MNIAILAHDNKKKLMVNICVAYQHILGKHTLHATGTTGQLVEEALGITVRKYLSGHLGGEQQLATQIVHNDIDLVIYLRDPLDQHHYETDAQSVLRLCDIHNIPLATNLATAEVLIQALERGDLDWRNNIK